MDFALYVVCVISLLIIDVHNVSVSYEVYIHDQAITDSEKPPEVLGPIDPAKPVKPVKPVESVEPTTHYSRVRKRSITPSSLFNLTLLAERAERGESSYSAECRQHPDLIAKRHI